MYCASAYPELKRVVCEQCEAFEVSVALIEDKAAGTQLIQELIYEVCTRSPATSRNPQSGKIMRMHAQTTMIENGFVYLPKEAPAAYLRELAAFPKRQV